HQGVTFLGSTGDHGSPGGYPSYSPNVVAVGGTSLSYDAFTSSYDGETAWSGSGGGGSQYETPAPYQHQFQNSGPRTTPDVALHAAGSRGVAVYDSFNGGFSSPWYDVGGTSLSAPCWAGLVASANQIRVSHGLATFNSSDPNEIHRAIYSLPSSDFHDI